MLVVQYIFSSYTQNILIITLMQWYIYIYTRFVCFEVKYFHFTVFDCQCENTMKIIFQFHCKIIFFSYFSKLNWCTDLQQKEKKNGAQTYAFIMLCLLFLIRRIRVRIPTPFTINNSSDILFLIILVYSKSLTWEFKVFKGINLFYAITLCNVVSEPWFVRFGGKMAKLVITISLKTTKMFQYFVLCFSVDSIFLPWGFKIFQGLVLYY